MSRIALAVFKHRVIPGAVTHGVEPVRSGRAGKQPRINLGARSNGEMEFFSTFFLSGLFGTYLLSVRKGNVRPDNGDELTLTQKDNGLGTSYLRHWHWLQS